MTRKSFIETDAAICDDTTSQDLKLSRISEKLVRCIQVMAVDTGTTKATNVAFGFLRGNRAYWIGGDVQATNNDVAVMTGPVYAPGDYVPLARVYGGTSGQTLSLTVAGYTMFDTLD